MAKFPKQLFVYRERDSGVVYYVATVGIDGLPEDTNREKIGVYTLAYEATHHVKRELKK
jgi:hypothetical protein